MNGTVYEIGKTSVRILIPSRRRDGGIVAREVRDAWANKAKAELEKAPFGGSTPTPVIGSFVHDDGRVTREEVTILTSSCSVSALDDESAHQRILAFAKELCAALGQESIFVGWGDTAFVVSATFDLESIPVVPFTELSVAAQLKHLTMGWGGIDDPSKVLQVLSLDTWTLPAKSAGDPGSGASDLSLRAVLKESGGLRRAWAWAGDPVGLKAARKGWKGTSEPQEGDLIFLRTRPDCIDVAMVQRAGLAGPRDLRQSHSQLNPVTRHLLLRILKREWTLLVRDLDQKPLDRVFFPKLQKLRVAVETAVRAGASPAVTLAPRSNLKRKKPTKEVAAVQKDARRSAFRTSVLVVGRMMFLRFLAAKGWVPNELMGLLDPYQQLKGDYFEKFIQPLWFDVLNTPSGKRTKSVQAQFAGGFPYLNGGLFQPRPGERELRLPGELFDPDVPGSFLQLFRDFEFSLNEHAGSDDTLRIDPSLFGKALESFNSLEDRKTEGVHYTPKPIAWALALEAILARVVRLAGFERHRIEGLLRGERQLSGQEASKLSRILGDLRVIDPAVGSGVLLWACLEVLLALDSACNAVSNGGDGYQRGSHTWGVRSRHFVCNCLYGVDLSEEAVELTRLRLWLAVALSEDEAQPLPDLELNICKGDSLLPAEAVLSRRQEEPMPKGKGKAKANSRQLPLGLSEPERLQNQLTRLTREYVAAGASDPSAQRTLRAEVFEVRRKLAAAGGDAGPDELPLDWRTFFPHVFRDEAKGGFDVVIANPPYIRIQEVKKSPAGKIYQKNWSTLESGNADLSFAFVELALRDLAAPNYGQVAFIQPNFRHHDAADTVRQLLLGRDEKVPASLRLWVDFDDAQVFPTATNYVALLFAERTPDAVPLAEFTYSNPTEGSWTDSEDLAWLRPKQATNRHPAEGEWLTLPLDLRERVLAARKRLRRRMGELAEVQVGVQTSADKVYLFEESREIDPATVEVLSRQLGRPVQLERALVRQCVKGSAGEGYLLLFPYDSNGQLLAESTLKKKFPKAWAYLTENRSKLEGREEGKFGGEGWYRFGRSQGTMVASQPKVLVPSLLRGPLAVLDRDGKLAFTASGKGGGGGWALIPKPGSGVSLQEIAAMVTTSEAWDHIRAYGSPQQGGWRGVDGEVLEGVPT